MLIEGVNCLTVQGSKYCRLHPLFMVVAILDEEYKPSRISPNMQKITFADPVSARIAGGKMTDEKRAGSVTQDAEFWRTVIEINPLLLFFVPIEYRTKELCSLAAGRNGFALWFVPVEMQDMELCTQAVHNLPYMLKIVREDLKTKELCDLAVGIDGEALEYVPNEFKTYELCLNAVKLNGKALKYVDVSKLTKQEYTEICRLAQESEK